MSDGERLTTTICVPLTDVRISDRRRRAINASKVEQYREWLEQGRQAPPVRLARDGDGFVVRDGRHRVLAAVAAGYADIDAVLSAIAGLGVPAMVIRILHRWWGARVSREFPTARAAATRRRSSHVCRVDPGGRSSGGRAPRLHRGGAGSTPAVSTTASLPMPPRGRAAWARGPLRLRSVNGKHAPFVRPRCGFDSCRRLLLVAVAQRRLRRGVQVRGRSSAGRAPERHFGEARSIRVVRFPQARGVSGSTASSNLAGPGSSPGGPALHDRRGPERLGYLNGHERP